jgi:hypothetical protein
VVLNRKDHHTKVVAADVPARADANVAGKQGPWPQPSFAPNASIDPATVTASDTSGGTKLATEGFPNPSFADYPALGTNAPTQVAGERGNARVTSGLPQPSFAN